MDKGGLMDINSKVLKEYGYEVQVPRKPKVRLQAVLHVGVKLTDEELSKVISKQCYGELTHV